MDLKGLIEAATGMIGDQGRKTELRAALYLGARLGLEAVLAEGNYTTKSDVQALLRSITEGTVLLDDVIAPPSMPSPLPEPVAIPEDSPL